MLAIKYSIPILLSLFSLTSWQKKIYLPRAYKDKQQTIRNFKIPFLNIMFLGQRRVLAGLLWIVTLAESDVDHYEQGDLNSWMYLRFLTISKLNPWFYENYRYAGLYLSVIKDDDLGAKDIYDRGLKLFPNDYQLLVNAAFHYLSELKDPTTALKLYKKVDFNRHPIPRYLIPVIANIEKKQNGNLVALYWLEKTYAQLAPGHPHRKYIRQRLMKLKEDIKKGQENSWPKDKR